MSLTRAELEQGLPHRLWSLECAGPRLLNDTELDASIDHVLNGLAVDADIWVFGYGSLMWNPLFEYAESRSAHLQGFQRRFCLWSVAGRGTADQPGLVLGLDHGGSCAGTAFRLQAAHARTDLRLLWRREMAIAAYCPRWVEIQMMPGGKPQQALTFLVNRTHPSFAENLPPEQVARILATARGYLGSSAEYLLNTLAALKALQLQDDYLSDLGARMDGTALRLPQDFGTVGA
jgi:cation transport protein ChaC